MSASQEHRRRIVAMIQDAGDTWDLSGKDRAALRHVMILVKTLADEVAAYRGTAALDVLERYGALVEQAEDELE